MKFFVTNLSVCKSHLKIGIARNLMFELFDYSKMKDIKLEII